MIEIIIIKPSMFAANTYIVYDKETLDAVIIDAGGKFDYIKKEIEALKLNVRGLLITHGHFDHIWVAKALQDYGLKVYIHKDDAEKLQINNYFNLKRSFPRLNADILLEEMALELGSIKIKVIHTPGHSKGGVCYVIDKAIFSGDTLFYMEIGRSDFPDGSEPQLVNSIKNKLFTLKSDYAIYPGHGDTTTLFFEMENNPYVKIK